MANFKKRYADLYEIPPEEDKKAKTLILEKKLQFNGDRIWK